MIEISSLIVVNFSSVLKLYFDMAQNASIAVLILSALHMMAIHRIELRVL